MIQVTGLYTQKLSNGVIFSVQIEDGAGMRRPINPNDYINKGYMPPIDDLPDISEYTKPKKIPPATQLLFDWHNGRSLTEEGLNVLRKYGFIHPDSHGVLQLTVPGRQTLEENNLPVKK